MLIEGRKEGKKRNQLMLWHPGLQAQCTGHILWGHLLPNKPEWNFTSRVQSNCVIWEHSSTLKLAVSESAGSILYFDEQPRTHSDLLK